MSMIRHQARTTIKVEIKRATKRAPEISTSQKTALDHERVDRVFGSLIGARADPFKTRKRLARHADPNVRSKPPGACGSGASDPRSPQPARRVLPDLLAVHVDPIADRMKQEDEERAARRKL